VVFLGLAEVKRDWKEFYGSSIAKVKLLHAGVLVQVCAGTGGELTRRKDAE
jgi:hypothetical protein